MLFAQVSQRYLGRQQQFWILCQEKMRHCPFLSHPPVLGLSCWSTICVPSILRWLSCSSSPTCDAHPGFCAMLGQLLLCGTATPLATPAPQSATTMPALRLQYLSPSPSFPKLRNTDTAVFPFQLMEGDRNSWPGFLWVDLTTLQRHLSCTYRDISWLTLTACGTARSPEFAETQLDLDARQNDFNINRTFFGKHVALHKGISAQGPPSTWA